MPLKQNQSGGQLDTQTSGLQNRRRCLKPPFGGTVEKNIPENAEWIDDAFYIKKTRFGLYTSILKEPSWSALYYWCNIRRSFNYVSVASQMPARWHPR